jgi:hypothetical protein
MKTLVSVASLAALFSLACATTGTAVGELHQGDQKPQLVKLVWKADGQSPERGSIWGDLPDGKHYSGRYYEVMENVPEQVYAGAWGGAEPYWPDWPTTGASPKQKADWNTFAAQYSGLAIANLTATAGGATIRCRFHVNAPSAGLVRGGSGECKLSDGATIDKVAVGGD